VIHDAVEGVGDRLAVKNAMTATRAERAAERDRERDETLDGPDTLAAKRERQARAARVVACQLKKIIQ